MASEKPNDPPSKSGGICRLAVQAILLKPDSRANCPQLALQTETPSSCNQTQSPGKETESKAETVQIASNQDIATEGDNELITADELLALEYWQEAQLQARFDRWPKLSVDADIRQMFRAILPKPDEQPSEKEEKSAAEEFREDDCLVESVIEQASIEEQATAEAIPIREGGCRGERASACGCGKSCGNMGRSQPPRPSSNPVVSKR